VEPTLYSTLQQTNRLGQLTQAQPGEAFANGNERLVEHGNALLMRDAIGLLDTSQQPIGLAAVVEDVCPPSQCKTDVERMPQPARIIILLVAQLRSLVR